MASIHLRVVGRTDRGRVRAQNEDSFVVADLTGGTLLDAAGASRRFPLGESGVLLVVSDGMGGADAGEVASALVVDTLRRAMELAPSSMPPELRIDEAVQKAHAKVWTTARERGQRMGATLTAVYAHGNDAFIAEVGDSRAYLIRAGKLVRLTHDQSLVQQLVDRGAMSTVEAASSPLRNVIVQAMGHQPNVKVALGRLPLRARDCFVLCSDGLTCHVSDEEIATTVLSSRDLVAACDALVDLANSRGGQDNITVVLGGVGGTLPAPSGPTDDPQTAYEVLRSFDDPA